MNAEMDKLISSLKETWPTNLLPVLASEESAIRAGLSGSLPYFTNTPSVAWVTLAPNAESLLAALTDLRAWIIPSIGWEEKDRGLIVTTAKSELGARILTISPSGYIRWRSCDDIPTMTEIASRLRRARELTNLVPPDVHTPVPTLSELRQQLATALATNDRLASEETLATINRFQLDTAQNALFYNLRILDHFGDSQQIVELPELEQLLRVRLPQSTRLAIAKAFYYHFIEVIESSKNIKEARDSFTAFVAPRIHILLNSLRPELGIEVRRLLAYRFASEEGSVPYEVLSGYADDPVITQLVQRPPEQATQTPLSTEAHFFAAWQTFDWAEVQRLGVLLLPSRPDLVPILFASLNNTPNPTLRDTLLKFQSPSSPIANDITAPQTWAEWFSLIPTGELKGLEQLLNARIGDGLLGVSISEGSEIAEKLTDLVTGACATLDQNRKSLLLRGIAELAGWCIGSIDFPNAGLGELYRAITNCWCEGKRGSAFPPDGQLLLELAEGLLQLSTEYEKWLADEVSQWWERRPASSLLPFMVAAIEIFHRLTGTASAERFWTTVGIFAKSQKVKFTQGEKLLWRKVGTDIGWDLVTLDEYVPLPNSETQIIDPLKAAALQKIAIVSLREEQAIRASKQIEERSGATVIVVTDTTDGAETKSARSADVIAFVWAATTHAVFRAFDKIDKDKIAYVQGTGSASIVLAVERWVTENLIPTTG